LGGGSGKGGSGKDGGAGGGSGKGEKQIPCGNDKEKGQTTAKA
jgi:hypothetical protein